MSYGVLYTSSRSERNFKKGNYKAIEFARDVVKAEGMDSNSDWINRIAERFIERFGTDEIDSSTFEERVRNKKEDW